MSPSRHNHSGGDFPRIRDLERAYCRVLGRKFEDFEEIVRFRADAQKAYTRLTRYVKDLTACLGRDDTEARQALSAYLDRQSFYHQRVLSWTAFLADLLLPDISSLDPSYKSFRKTRREITEQSSALQRQLRTCAQTHTWAAAGERRIFLSKARLDKLDVNSGPWRLAYQRLCHEVRLYLRAVLAAARYDIRGQLDHVLLDQLPEEERPRVRKAADWLRGYYPPLSSIRTWYEDTAARVRRSVRRSARTRLVRKWTIAVLTLAVAAVGLNALQQTRLDDQLWRRIVFETKKLFRRDFHSRDQKQKSEYFEREIAAIDEQYTPQMIRDNIDYFYGHEFKDRPEAALYFARHVLKGFFLLLPDWDLSQDLKDEVVRAGHDFDPRVGNALENIVYLYRHRIVREGQIRRQMLALRRAFIRYNVFLFTFIALENDVPYLFLFSETVQKNYQITERAWHYLGVDPAPFARAELWPAMALVVEGEDYPFADKAGYFEGEFAVVFRRFSDKVSWTAFHEIGHVVDHLRLKYEDVPLPGNVELNAMLFPIIWDHNDRKDYIAGRLYHEVSKADPNDKYAQAAKGILNGFVLYFGRQYPDKVRDLLISDNFERDRIKRILDHLLRLPSRALKIAGYALFRESDKYLSTAKPGSYIAYATNFQEIIYGTGHTVAQRGFILGGGGLFGPRNGPRLMFENDGDDSLGGGFNLRTFVSNVLGLLFYRKQNWPQSTTAESITASVLFFVLFNALAFLLHASGTSYRRRRFYGRDLDKAVRRIYDRNPWSSGYSAGREEKERQLLSRVWRARGKIPDGLKKDLAAFKAVAVDKQRFMLDACLFLSPLQPRRCAILNKAHDLLFFLPFLGPLLARQSWIWPVQKKFHRWQKYNAEIEDMLANVNKDTGTEELRQQLGRILARYTGPSFDGRDGDADMIAGVFDEIKRDVRALLRRPAPMVHMSLDLLRDKMTETNEPSVEFERLEVYTPGDDIRHIDWKSTARYPQSDPMVRRFSSPYGARVALWLDARGLFTEEDKQQWASDLARSVRILHMLRGEAVLEKIILTGPEGRVAEYPVRLSAETDLASLAGRILTAAQEKFRRLYAGKLPFRVQGLDFYDEEESVRFMRQLRLSDLAAGSPCDLRLVPLKGKRMNIFVVGAKMDQKETIQTLAGEENRVHYW